MKFKKQSVWFGLQCLLLPVCIVLGTGCDQGPSTKRAGTLPPFEPVVVIPNAFPAIIKPDSVSAKEADTTLKDDELVLGVEVNGESRAYPINMLTGPVREIINDELGGIVIAATW